MQAAHERLLVLMFVQKSASAGYLVTRKASASD